MSGLGTNYKSSPDEPFIGTYTIGDVSKGGLNAASRDVRDVIISRILSRGVCHL